MAGGVSPFDTAIVDMVHGQELRIACPYLNLSYLLSILQRGKSWRLLTDVQEWLISQGQPSRREIVDFVLANRERIRHCKDLHAKVLIAGTRALAGSANFTEKGITGRVELSVLFDECEQVEEMQAWFDLLWNRTAPVGETELSACVAAMPPPTSSSGCPPLLCLFPGVRSRLKEFGTELGENADAEARLIERLSELAPDRQWAENYLDLVQELVEVAGLSNDDHRLATTLPKSEELLPVNVNGRYVLTAFRAAEGYPAVILILPASMRESLTSHPALIDYGGQFSAKYHGEAEAGPPFLATFDSVSKHDLGEQILSSWREAFLAERDHAKGSLYRRYHEPVVYKAATDLHYRQRLLDRAFPVTGS